MSSEEPEQNPPEAEAEAEFSDNGRKIPLGDPNVTTVAVRRQAEADARLIAKGEAQLAKVETQFLLLAWGNVEAKFQLVLAQGQRLLKMRERIPQGYVGIWRFALAAGVKGLGHKYGEDRIQEDMRLARAVKKDPTLAKSIPAVAMTQVRSDFRRLMAEIRAPEGEDDDDDDEENEPEPNGPAPTPEPTIPPMPHVPPVPLPDVEPDPDPAPEQADPAVVEARNEVARVRSELESEQKDNEELEDMMHTIQGLTLAPGQITYCGQHLEWAEPKPVGDVLEWMSRAYEAAEPEPESRSIWDRIRRPEV